MKQDKLAVSASAHLAAPSIHHKDIQRESIHGIECMRLTNVEIEIALQRHICSLIGSQGLYSGFALAKSRLSES